MGERRVIVKTQEQAQGVVEALGQINPAYLDQDPDPTHPGTIEIGEFNKDNPYHTGLVLYVDENGLVPD